jgi:hypothetical protein
MLLGSACRVSPLVRGLPASGSSARLAIAYEVRERLGHRHVMPGVTDGESDLIACSRLVSEHQCDAVD